ncbi:hypothetical protein M3P36_12740 [Altererythrobacter sp. KTW20L]|uniref:hypothetical protein n=1 Tax=Altererythrobacter sp. KTW20L TaxID=2942210 RepID=UPI0020BFCA9D|nr:hypothetical protein [Altererythrobacter sp. KTW20L]MCL6251906.1 hypothetical protein [Altererythrobacter sp. KTW20L]
MSGSLFGFMVAVLVVVINGLIAMAVAKIWLTEGKARIAGFAFVLGAGIVGGGRDFGFAAGTVVGLIALWLLLFKREKALA